MGLMIVALDDQLKWPIDAPLADEIGESLYKGKFRQLLEPLFRHCF